jgi:ribulose bisphosphate carboxylase small subunit
VSLTRAARSDLDSPISALLSPVSRPRSPGCGEGSEDSPKQEDRKNESRTSKTNRSNAIEQLRQALEAGHSERLKEYLAAMARFRRYSWHNVMLIASQQPNATHVTGFHAWHKLGRFVKKGEKGILILAPIIRKKAENNPESEPDESSTAIGFRAAYVFDISQTDGQPFPEIGSVNGDPCQYRERLAKFVAEHGIALEYSDDIAPARGISSGGKITLLPGQSLAEEFATLAHEVGHLCVGGIYVALQSGWRALRGISCSDGHIIFVNANSRLAGALMLDL